MWYLRRYLRTAEQVYIGPFRSSQDAAKFRAVWDLGDWGVLRTDGWVPKAATPSGFARNLARLNAKIGRKPDHVEEDPS